MKSFPVVLLAFIAAFSAFSQENFIPGYIVKLNNDTVLGTIDYRNWKTCPDEISFIPAGGMAKQVFRPGQINGFTVSGQVYESANVQIEASPVNKSYLEYDQAFRYRDDTVFLQVRYRGNKSLYLYIDENRRDQFYIRDDTSFTVLAYKRYLVETGDYSRIYIGENNRFIGQLTDYLKDCPALAPKISSTGYYTGSIEKLFREYAKCTGEKYDFIRVQKERRTEFGFLAGSALTWSDLNGNLDQYLSSVDMGLSAGIAFGVLFDFIRFDKARKWSWSNEFLLSTFGYEGSLLETTNENDYTNSVTMLDGAYLKWHTLARYKIPAGKLTFYANAGPALGIGGLTTNTVAQTRNFYGQIRKNEKQAIEDPKKFEAGLAAGLGARLKRFTLEARYEFGTGFADNEDVSSNAHRVYLLLGIRL